MAGNIPAAGGPGSYDQPVSLVCIIPYFQEKRNTFYRKNYSISLARFPPNNSICTDKGFYTRIICLEDIFCRCFKYIYTFPYIHRRGHVFRHSSQFKPILFDRSSIAKINLFSNVNVVCDGSPSRILMVLLISLGITTRPRSSILLTIPVAFIYIKSPCIYRFVMLVSAKEGDLYCGT